MASVLRRREKAGSTLVAGFSTNLPLSYEIQKLNCTP